MTLENHHWFLVEDDQGVDNQVCMKCWYAVMPKTNLKSTSEHLPHQWTVLVKKNSISEDDADYFTTKHKVGHCPPPTVHAWAEKVYDRIFGCAKCPYLVEADPTIEEEVIHIPAKKLVLIQQDFLLDLDVLMVIRDLGIYCGM